MPLTYGFAHTRGENEEETPLDRATSAAYERLSETEKHFFHADPFFQLGVPFILMSTDVSCICEESIDHIIWRLRHNMDVMDFVRLCLIAKQETVGHEEYEKIDAEDILKWSGSGMEKTLKEWLLDRFTGYSANVHNETPNEWMKARIKGKMPKWDTKRQWRIFSDSVHAYWDSKVEELTAQA